MEGMPCLSIMEQFLELAQNWVRAAAMVRRMGDASADLDLGYGIRRRHH